MVKHEFEFKKRGGSSNITIEIDDGVMTLPAISFKNPADTCKNIARIIRTMLNENWTQIEIKEK